jgi:hypothetical protein
VGNRPNPSFVDTSLKNMKIVVGTVVIDFKTGPGHHGDAIGREHEIIIA